MRTYSGKYGELTGISSSTAYEDGAPKDCSFEECVELNTSYGVLIPQYTYDYRRKNIYAVSFYPDGALRRISLEQATKIDTPVGSMPAELITFYPEGGIKRLFPLNGQLSAYWEEDDEYQMAKEYSFDLGFARITARPIAISFYEDGKLKDLTFWPREKIRLRTPAAKISARIGLSLYPEGTLKSVEPAYPTKIDTPIGALLAYDRNANGISGDVNSLNFTQEGRIRSLTTSGNTITILDSAGQTLHTYTPGQEVDEDGSLIAFQTLTVAFEQDCVIFNHSESYEIQSHGFIIGRYLSAAASQCDNCESCNLQCSSF